VARRAALLRFAVLTCALAGAAGALSCAQAYPPPGDDPDRLPPALIGTSPEPLAVVPEFREPVVFRFDERLSERGFSEALVTVSPQDSTVRVQRARTEVRVSIDGGWRPDRIYRVVLLPGIRDLFGNTREEAVEVVFSTGPPVPNTAVAGMVMDRLTGRGAQNAMVMAVRRGEAAAYTAVGDTGGFFSLRHLPLGVYDVTAFADLNRNRRLDSAEPLDSARVSLGAATDTTMVVFNVLAADSTAPRATRAEAVDSLHVRVTFDDHFDPGDDTGGAAQVHVLPDSSSFAAGTAVMVSTVFERRQREAALEAQAAQAAARADSVAAAAAADTTAADTAAADTARPAAPRTRQAQQAPPQAAEPETPPLPSRDLVVRLDRPLPPGRYAITVSDVTNINGLTGGGTAVFEVRAPPPEPEADAPPDSVGGR
jgi:hypothetical protein